MNNGKQSAKEFWIEEFPSPHWPGVRYHVCHVPPEHPPYIHVREVVPGAVTITRENMTEIIAKRRGWRMKNISKRLNCITCRNTAVVYDKTMYPQPCPSCEVEEKSLLPEKPKL